MKPRIMNVKTRHVKGASGKEANLISLCDLLFPEVGLSVWVFAGLPGILLRFLFPFPTMGSFSLVEVVLRTKIFVGGEKV
jgi:hypothetical protein